MKTKVKTILFLALAMIAAPPANAAFIIIATDDVEALGNYTHTGMPAPATTGPTTGLSPVAGSFFVRTSDGGAGARSSTARLTAGFGATILVEAGTYQLTAYFGEFEITRDTWHAVDLSLMTTAGVAWQSTPTPITRNVTLPYLNPNGVGATAEWVPVTVEYEIPEGHALIGTQFTWGFTATKPSNGIGFFGGFDAATVEFEAIAAIPEPSAALLSGLGGLLLFLRRRR